MNYYSFHIGDFIAATVHLTPMEELAYRRLLDMYYDTEANIPLETQSVSRRLRLDTEIVDSVLNEFFTRTETGWANHRCDAEIAAYQRKAEANRANGKRGGRPKKTQSVILANPNESESNLNQEPRTNNQYKEPAPAKAAAFCFKTALLEAGATPQLAADWLAVRKTKKASNTKTALNGFLAEVGKSGHTINQALEVCCSRSWQGFNAEWVKDIKPAPAEAIPFDRAAYDAKKKADMAAAREIYKREQDAAIVPVRAAK